MKSILTVVILSAFLVLTACQRKDEKQPIPQTPIQPQTSSDSKQPADNPMMNPHGAVKKSDKKIEVPEAVKKKWSKVVLIVEDKKTNKKSELTVNIGSEATISGTKINIKTGEFLPDFKMGDNSITSASTELNNPALRVEISEEGKVLFKGWLYSKFPEVHPFEHERFSVMLKQPLQ